MHRFPEIFSKNRNEESKEDNWAEFVVPPFLHDLGVKSQTKALVIVGGRGCGKTTLLRYFCHATQFSPRRPTICADDLAHIGLYWRADTNFLNSFTGGQQSPETWRAAFEHLLACELGKEIIRSLSSLNCNPERQRQYGGLGGVDLTEVSDFTPGLGTSLGELDKALQRSRTALAMWVNNLDTCPKPIFLPVEAFLRTLVQCLKRDLPYLAESRFSVFIDEYENLRDEQQRYINGLLKHGSPPLIFNIAMKRNGWQTTRTLGPESIQEISDYRVIDLEDSLSDYFELFAAELLFFRLAEHEPDLLDKLPITPDQLRSINDIDQRYQNVEYRNAVIAAAEKMLPRVGERAASREIFSDSKLLARLEVMISDALQTRGYSLNPQLFLDKNYPEASVLMPALLNRSRESPERLLSEFQELKRGVENRLSATGSLAQNNLFGCVNAIYIDAQRNSILFSGFVALTLIARGNIRHLLELIHRIFKTCAQPESGELPVIPPNIQASAVREASESILSTVKGHGTHGPRLYALAQCLGSIFKARHRSDKQSEAEINHFTLAGGEVGDQLQKYLYEAEKWSVLFVTRETKMKTTGAISSDYVLNPIFAPYFQISYRKKRSIQLTAPQLTKMFEGDQRTRDGLVRELGNKESVLNENRDLFEGLD